MSNDAHLILVIADGREQLTIYEALIEESFPGSVILTAQSAKEGFKVAHAQEPDIILLDIVSPEMDGFCRLLKVDPLFQETPMIFVTAMGCDTAQRRIFLEAGAEAFISKPVDEVELYAQMRSVLKIRELNLHKRAVMVSEERFPLMVEDISDTVDIIDTIYDGSGKLLKTLSIGLDRTRQREMDEMLTEYRDHLEELVATRTRELNEANRQLTMARIIGNTITADLGFETIMDRLYQKFRDLGDIDVFYVALYDRPSGMITFHSYYRSGGHMTPPPRKLADDPGLCGYVIEQRKTLHLRDSLELPSEIRLVRVDGRPTQSIIAVPLMLADQVIGVLSMQSFAPNAYTPDQVSTVEMLGTQLAVAIRNSQLYGQAQQEISMRKKLEEELEKQRDDLQASNERLMKWLHQSASTISKIGDLRDPYTAGHQRMVQTLACEIGRQMGLSAEAIMNISYGSLIHDIGKINIPSDILNKPGKITAIEYQLLQTHAEHSHAIVSEIDFAKEIRTMVYQHHERLDGSGYPQGLSGDEIILESRILAVADVVEAMTSHRPYRPALGIDAALEEVTFHKGTKYDADVVDICVKLFRDQGFRFAYDS
jgi:response regulator RpfG family c-di-GMP phosphodiesterase